MTDIHDDTVQRAAKKASRYRWKIVALLFAATVINYIDRQMIGVLKPTLAADLGWTESDFANVIIFFQLAYAIGYIGFGRVIDLLGARLGYAVAFVIWQIAHMAHGAAFSVGHFAAARFALGIGEAGNFPAAIKAVTEWFPARERAFAIGIFNAGANIGAVITPLVVPIIVLHYGWRAAFVITGVVAFAWLVAWLIMYRAPADHPKVNSAERAWIDQDPEDGSSRIRWARVIRRRETWAYAIGKFFIDPIWWFFLFWLPSYLGTRYGLDLVSFGPPLAAIYLLSDIGSVAGGWASSRLMTKGYSVNAARKITMMVCAVAVLPIFIVQSIDNLWLAVLVIGLATAAHQAFSANLYTLPSDIFPRAAVASVIGIGGTAGAIGGMMMSKFAGFILDGTGSYAPLFAIAAGAYFAALLAVHALSPRLARVEMPTAA